MLTHQMKETQALLALLGFELFEKDLAFDFSEINWQTLLSAANAHAVTPLLYSSVGKVSGVPQNVYDAVERFAVRSTIRFERMIKIQREIFDALTEARIPAVVLKGTSVATFYRHPEVRMTGDIDILVSKEDMQSCKEVLERAGYLFESRSELHDVYRKKSAMVEVHHRVSRFPATRKGEYASGFLQGALAHVNMHTIGGESFPMLEDAHHLVALLAHTERHITASGISLRQLCDWAVAVLAVDVARGDEITCQLDECGLLTFAKVLTGICEKYLGMPRCQWMNADANDLTDAIMSEILSVGNFQAQCEQRPYASAIIDPYDLDGDGKRRVLKTYLRKVERKMESEFPWAKSRMWVPILGVYYFAGWTVALLKGETSAKGMLNTLRTSRERERLLRKMGFYR